MTLDSARRNRFEAVAEEVFEPLQRYLHRRAPSDDAADLLSEVLMVVWRRLDDIPTDPLPWSYGVARRILANHHRSRRRHLRLVERLESAATVDAQPTGAADTGLEEALAALTEIDREVLRLWAWEQLEPREIAQVLDTSPNAAALRLSRARRKLAEEMLRQRSTSGGQKGDRHPEEHRK